ncbi:LysM peptidoglycan-binding domain-containing protein [Draconibacterium sp. IB214405]|uniref:LysM peptidoglycan-binding domain-containing protein n=1 Tax=Draconibacterium sp. IB214405 TaxID=3097352 RepID=UPI002A10F933|nr:LysM peptidoglycan-binding domain-containing protein [Draconibacterium sp. IB214405]MDX8340303.1 LysM peptidoglycan-binding domain-containing protein [Draconibacterium sp. IB214405]
MKRLVQNKPGSLIGIFVVLLLFVPLVNWGQDSINGEDFQYRLLQSIQNQVSTYPWNDASFFPGKIENADGEQELDEVKEYALNQHQFETCFTSLMNLNSAEKEVFVKSFYYYNSFIKQELKKADLSDELQYLPAVLSAMNLQSTSKYKRAGVWQLSHFQGVLNGLTVDKLVDERLDVEKATHAAVREFKKNERLFDHTKLALLAFVFGKTEVKNLCLRAGEDFSLNDFFAIAPDEMVDFISTYQAVAGFLEDNKYVSSYEPQKTAETKVRFQTHFDQISAVLPISVEHLRFLNPQYPYSIIPEQASITLPEKIKQDFLFLQDSIYNGVDSTLFEVVAQKIEYPPAPNRQYVGEPVKDLQIEGKTKIKYTIKSGDVLGFIAEDYDVRVADLKYWNNIYNERKIQAGKTLDIFVDNENADYYSGLQQQKAKKEVSKTAVPYFTSAALPGISIPESATKVEHVVKSGESPYVIAKKYDGVTPEKILEWNSISDARKIQIGQKLIIYVQ